MRILVTGVSGFVGAMLAPRLLADGHDVRALSREPVRASTALRAAATLEARTSDWPHAAATPGTPNAEHDAPFEQDLPLEPTRDRLDSTCDRAREIEVIRGDVVTGEGLAQALDGVEVAYYLIHSMESQPRGAAAAHVFPERERVGASNFAAAARRAGVRRIVYLGGLVPRERAARSRHLASREAVEDILLEQVPGSVALRSAIVIGARSRSFRLLVRLIERMPVLALPPWRGFRTQPIDARDAIEMLLAAAHAPAVGGLSLDIGGREAITYEDLLRRIADLMLLGRPTLSIGVAATPLTARLAAALSGEDPELILALMDGLQSDLLPAGDRAPGLLGVQLHSLDAAIEHALREWEAVEPLAAR